MHTSHSNLNIELCRDAMCVRHTAQHQQTNQIQKQKQTVKAVRFEFTRGISSSPPVSLKSTMVCIWFCACFFVSGSLCRVCVCLVIYMCQLSFDRTSPISKIVRSSACVRLFEQGFSASMLHNSFEDIVTK